MSANTLSRTERRRQEREAFKQQRKSRVGATIPQRGTERFHAALIVLLIAVTATLAAIASPSFRSWFGRSHPISLQTMSNQTAVRLDDGGLAYATDNHITAFHGDNPRHRQLIGLQYTVGSVDDTDYHSLLWRSVEMSLQKPDGGLAEISATRPLWWFDVTKAKEGATVPLDIHEAGVSGMATVHKIASLTDTLFQPPTPDYHPVIGTIKHLNASVLELTFEGAQNEPLGVTPNHPLWSEDRHEWIPAGELRIGEQVATKDAFARLLRSEQKPGKHTVYNIEVHRSHAYHVGGLGLIAHNTSLECQRVLSVYEDLRMRHFPGDPLDAYERTKNRMNSLTKWSQTLKTETVDGVILDIERLKSSGELDKRLVALGNDASGFQAREVFAGRRFEMKSGKSLTRSNQGADFFDGTKHWDVKGPFPQKFFDQQWTNIRSKIDEHYLYHGQAKDEYLLIDLAGLHPSQKQKVLSHLRKKDPIAELFEVLDD